MRIVSVARSIGRYQWLVLFLYTSWNITEWYNLGILVMAPDIEFKCMDANVTGPQCYVDEMSVNVTGFRMNELAPYNYNNSKQSPCRHFEFDHSKSEWTLTERYDLICDRKWIISMMKTVCLVGYFLSSLCFGAVADRFGRKGTAVFGGAGFIIASICQIFVPNVWAYVSLRFLQSIFSFSFYLSMYVLATESLRKEQRIFPKFLDSSCYDVFTALLGGASFLIKSYVHYHIVFAAAGSVTLLLVCLLVHESPRWLYAKQSEERANQTVEKIAQFNGSDVEELRYLTQKCEKERISPLSLFKTPVIRKRTILLMFIWFVYVFGFYAIAYNINQFYEDVRLSLLVSGSIEIFSAVPVVLMIKKFGRSSVLFALLFGTGLCCLAMSPMVGWKTHPALLTLALTGRLLISNALFLIYIYTPELYPTVVRATGLGVCNTASRVVGAVAPQLALLNDYWPPAMVVVLGIVTISASFLIPLLPDTTDVELPQTIDDGENLFANHRYNLRKAKVNIKRLEME